LRCGENRKQRFSGCRLLWGFREEAATTSGWSSSVWLLTWWKLVAMPTIQSGGWSYTLLSVVYFCYSDYTKTLVRFL
jgi:hypothetical protein